jgi:chromosome segregation ATPase
MDADTKAAFRTLTTVVEKGFGAADKKFEALAEDIADLRAELKGDIASLGAQLTSIEAELRGINRRLDFVEEQIGSLKGFSKEIDDLRARIAQIEKHLGISKKIAA